MAAFEGLVETINEKPVALRLGILIAIILVICGVYWHFFWSPKVEELTNARDELQREETKLREYEAVAKELPKFQQEFNKLDNEFNEAASKLPEEKEIPSLIDSVYAAVSASGLESDTFAPKGEVKKEIYAEIPVDMKVFGSYYDLAGFFDRVSRLPRIVNIRDLNLSMENKRSAGGRVVLEASFTAVTFRLLPPPPPETEGAKKLEIRKEAEPE